MEERRNDKLNIGDVMTRKIFNYQTLNKIVTWNFNLGF